MPVGRLFTVELTEIADCKSKSKYMLYSNFRKKNLVKGHRRELQCTYLYNAASLSSDHFLNISLSFMMFYPENDQLNKIKILWNFHEQTQVVFNKPIQVVLVKFSQGSNAKCRG